MSEQIDPSHIMEVGLGFWPSKTLLSAVELDTLGAAVFNAARELNQRLQDRASRRSPAAVTGSLDALPARAADEAATGARRGSPVLPAQPSPRR